jgi:hypothetical protein
MPAVRRSCATLIALVSALVTVSAAGQDDAAALEADDAFDRTPVDCISVSSIDRTDVIDDRTILFFMRGRKIYRNYLPRRCPGLERHDRFAYQTTSNRLCDIDTITVLEQWGARLQPGFVCPLGAFHPIPLEEVEELKLTREAGGAQRNAIEGQPVDLPAQGDPPAADEAAEPGSPESD